MLGAGFAGPESCDLFRRRHAGITLWTLWTGLECRTEPTESLREDAERAESAPAGGAAARRRDLRELVERLPERLPEEPGRGVVVGVRAAGRLGNDRVDHAQLEAVRPRPA